MSVPVLAGLVFSVFYHLFSFRRRNGAGASFLCFRLVSSLLSLWGIRAACVASGGAKGGGFVGKFRALGWVLVLRGLIFFVPLYLLLCVLAGMVMAFTGLLQAAGEKEFQAAVRYALYVALLLYVAWYYWRLSINLRRLRAGE